MCETKKQSVAMGNSAPTRRATRSQPAAVSQGQRFEHSPRHEANRHTTLIAKRCNCKHQVSTLQLQLCDCSTLGCCSWGIYSSNHSPEVIVHCGLKSSIAPETDTLLQTPKTCVACRENTFTATGEQALNYDNAKKLPSRVIQHPVCFVNSQI